MGVAPWDASLRYAGAYEQGSTLVQAFVMIVIIFICDGFMDCTRVQKNHKSGEADCRRTVRRVTAEGLNPCFRGPDQSPGGTAHDAGGG